MRCVFAALTFVLVLTPLELTAQCVPESASCEVSSGVSAHASLRACPVPALLVMSPAVLSAAPVWTADGSHLPAVASAALASELCEVDSDVPGDVDVFDEEIEWYSEAEWIWGTDDWDWGSDEWENSNTATGVEPDAYGGKSFTDDGMSMGCGCTRSRTPRLPASALGLGAAAVVVVAGCLRRRRRA